MKASEVRQKFLEYFEKNGHKIHPSSALVPNNDPTLLFTNAGMVQFKRVFLGEEKLDTKRAVTSQKCLRVSGKHNDLEEVGVTARHHTFFEMLGNFSFGDYFKRDAIKFAWELLTEVYGIPRERLWATVHYTDDEAAKLWEEIAGLPASRIFRLGDKDNFWQMGDTGPCGPCSEIHFDLRPVHLRGTEMTTEQFEEHSNKGEFLELWNLVFMQFDRSADGVLTPLPAPSIDTGAGLERVTAVLQGVDANYKTDLFTPLIDRAVQIVGVPYVYDTPQGVSYRVLADHARAVAFLLADGVFPSNEGRGYVLRRVLRRAVRHAWLLGRREPTLVHVVDKVIDEMSGAYPDLQSRREHLIRNTREEEERFLATIEQGMTRIDELAPVGGSGMIAGEDVFKLYDTFGFPVDLTELIARERGYDVDSQGFDDALERQRARSRQDRKAAGHEMAAGGLADGWEELDLNAEQRFIGYTSLATETDIISLRRQNGRIAVQLRDNPFYVESGGQVNDSGVIEGDGWRMVVDDVKKVSGRVAVLGDVEGDFPRATGPVRVRAHVVPEIRRDTQRNHTATHLLHAALRNTLGTHVVQRGSLVAPDRLRFDFSHPRPMTPEEIRKVEDEVNRRILEDHDVNTNEMKYADAVSRGAMALFGEKYGDEVRVVMIPDVSMELCGGTHVRHTGDIGLFRIVSEGGIASGVRRIEAVTGSGAYRRTVEQEMILQQAAATLKTPSDNFLRRLEQLVEENKDLRKQLEKARASGSADMVGQLIRNGTMIGDARIVATTIDAGSADELRTIADTLREQLGTGAGILAATLGSRTALVAVVTDDLIGKGVRADALVKLIAASTGGSGGGKPTIAQGGIGDSTKLDDAFKSAVDSIRAQLS